MGERGSSPGTGVRWPVALAALAMAGALAVIAGCPKRADDGLPPCAAAQGRRRSTPVERCLAVGDAHFEDRAREGELDRALSAYHDALLLAPNDATVLARVARAYATRGYAFPDENGESYRLGREIGLRCLRTAPDVQGAITASGGVLTLRAISSADANLAPCMLWTALAWARTLEAGGVAGASIDLRPLQALARRVVELTPDLEGGLPHAALGLSLALAPAPLKPDLGQAERQLKMAIQRAPWRLSAQVDLATLVHGPKGDEAAWRQTLTEVSTAAPGAREIPENLAAIARAKAALEAGMPDAQAWWR